MNNICDRCGEKSNMFRGSFFNTEMICIKCYQEESNHMLYKKARDIEFEEVKKGNLNFEGIGLPEELKK